MTHGVAISRTPSLPFASPTSIAAKPPSAGPMDAVATPPKTRKNTALSKEISLKELASGHSKSFPLRIRTLEGYRGQTSQLSISIAEEYSIHFVKHQKVVTIKDSSRQLYSVPLSSAIRFGLIYKPAVSSEPFIFESVSDIIMSKSLPKVVCAMEAYAGDTDRASLSANEVLCITRVHKPKFHGKKSLEVFSLVTNTKKLLTLDCCVHFSTDPSLVQVHLPSILDHIPNLFPGQAVLFADEDFTKSVPYSSSALLSSPVTLINSQTKTSLVASPVINREIPFEEGDCLIDIPLDEPLADVKIVIVQPDDASEVKRLQSKTQTLYETMDLSKVQTYQDAASENVYETQSLLNFSLERGHERVGIEIDAPSTIFGKGPPQVESMVSEENQIPSSTIFGRGPPQVESMVSEGDPIPSDEDDLYETVSLPKGRLALPAYEDMQAANMQEKPYETIYSDDSSDYEVFEKSEYSVLAEKIEKLQQQVRNLESSFSSQEEGHTKSMKSLEEKVEQLTVQFKSLETQITQMSMNSVVRGSGAQMPMRHHGDGGGSSEDRNRSALQRLSVAQVSNTVSKVGGRVLNMQRLAC